MPLALSVRLGVVLGAGFPVSVESKACALVSFFSAFNFKSLHSEKKKKAENQKAANSLTVQKWASRRDYQLGLTAKSCPGF